MKLSVPFTELKDILKAKTGKDVDSRVIHLVVVLSVKRKSRTPPLLMRLWVMVTLLIVLPFSLAEAI